MAYVPIQTPFGIYGVVARYEVDAGTQSTKYCRGARIWAQDITEGTHQHREETVSFHYTNSKGEYIMNVAEITSNYADNDTVRVYCKWGDMVTFKDVRIAITTGFVECNFELTRKSRLLDGLKDTTDARGKFGLKKWSVGLKRGLKDGMK